MLAVSALIASDARSQSPSVHGAWFLIEQTCLTPRDRVVIGPGFPGSKEEWILKFQTADPIGTFAFSAIYIGINSNGCRAEFNGDFELEVGPSGFLSSVFFFPDKLSVKRSGSFEPPCRVLSADRAQKFDARFEMTKGSAGRGQKRLRLQGPDFESRCEGPLDRMELLFESQ